MVTAGKSSVLTVSSEKKEDAAEVVSRGYRKGFLSHLWEAQRDIKFITLTGCSGVISSGPGVRGKS